MCVQIVIYSCKYQEPEAHDLLLVTTNYLTTTLKLSPSTDTTTTPAGAVI